MKKLLFLTAMIAIGAGLGITSAMNTPLPNKPSATTQDKTPVVVEQPAENSSVVPVDSIPVTNDPAVVTPIPDPTTCSPDDQSALLIYRNDLSNLKDYLLNNDLTPALKTQQRILEANIADMLSRGCV